MTTPTSKGCCEKCDIGTKPNPECDNPSCKCHKESPVSQSEGWTTTFLKAGTRELGIDCSILVGIVGNLIDSAKQEALSTLVKEMEGLEVGKGTEYNRGFNDGISAAQEVVNRLNK